MLEVGRKARWSSPIGEVVIMVGIEEIKNLKSKIKGETLLLDRYGKLRENTHHVKDSERVKVVVIAADKWDVVEAVSFARRHGLRHLVLLVECLPDRYHPAEVFISTCRMTEVRVDPNMWTAWIQAGCTWERVIAMAESRGMAPLFPYTVGCGAVSHLLGERLNSLEQEYGIVSDNVKFFEVVNEEGEQEKVTREEHAELFFALCRGEVGQRVITALEIRLYPYKDMDRRYLLYPVESAKELLAAYIANAGEPGDRMPDSIVLANFPALPVIPRFLQERSVVMIRIQDPEKITREGPDFWEKLREPIFEVPGAMAFLEEELICSDPRKPLSRLSRDIYIRDLGEAACERILFSAFEKNQGAPLMFTLVREDELAEPGKRQGFHIHLTGLLLRKEDHALHLSHTARLHYDLRNDSVWRDLIDEQERQTQRKFADGNIMNLDLERRKIYVSTHFSPEQACHYQLEFRSLRDEIMKLSR